MYETGSGQPPANDVTFLVVSCDAYKDLWKPFFTCFFKYWPDCPYQVCLASNNEVYPDARVRNISIGPDKDYSTNVVNILAQIETKWLILWFEDAFLSTKLDTARIQHLIALAQQHQVGYLKLSADAPLVLTKDKGQEIGPIPKGVKYRGAVGMALYQKETLLKLLVPGESAWQLDRSSRSNSFEEPFYALTTHAAAKPPLPFEHAVMKGKWCYTTPGFLRKEGLADCIPNRKTQSLKTYLYIKLYLFRLWLYQVRGQYWYE